MYVYHIYRDVKPANVMICSNMHTLKLVDFGLAVSLSNKRSRAGVIHTHTHTHTLHTSECEHMTKGKAFRSRIDAGA